MTPVEGPERRRAFCARLKSERERRGTSLRTIAESTKVKASLLEALERGDVSRWPKGIYRRSFFREYVASFGLPSEQYAAEFLELFPDGEEPPPTSQPPKAAPPVAPPPVAPLRLTLAPDPGVWRRGLGGGAVRPRRLSAAQPFAAVFDLAVVLGVAYAIAAAGISIERAAAAVAVVYYSVGTALAGRSPGSWLIARRTRVAPLQAAAQAPAAAAGPQPAEAAGRSKLRTLASDALRTRSTLRGYVAQFSRAASLGLVSERRRDLSHLRRRRVETANRAAVDEAV